MPYAARCFRCNYIIFSASAENIRKSLVRHFIRSHKRLPEPDPTEIRLNRKLLYKKKDIAKGVTVWKSKTEKKYAVPLNAPMIVSKDYVIERIPEEWFNSYCQNPSAYWQGFYNQ